MASLTLEDGRTLTSLSAIQKEMEPLGIQLSSWPTGDDPDLVGLLDTAALDDDQKETVLQKLDHYFEQLQQEAGYQTRDLIVLHDAIDGLDQALKKFASCHTHDDDEVRYIIDGEGVFGFVRPDGSQVALKVERGEFINVPKDTEHWFVLTDSMRIKAVRYFTSTEGWVPRYTGTEARL